MSFDEVPVLKVEDATIYQDFNPVLKDVNFAIEKGEFVFLIGKTGSGKSSLLKTLYADLPLKQGRIEIAGYDLNLIRHHEIYLLRRKLGIIFQDFQLLHDRTIAENLIFAMKATGWTEKSKIQSRMAEVLMRVGLGSAGSKYPYQLSGGEQQRIVVARALINEPAILLADEPTGNLDPDVAKGIYNLFREINSSGTAVLMATHNHQLVKDNTLRILKCQDGALLDSKLMQFDLKAEF